MALMIQITPLLLSQEHKQLLVGGNIDYETTPSLNIYVQASDGTNTLAPTKALTVNVQ